MIRRIDRVMARLPIRFGTSINRDTRLGSVYRNFTSPLQQGQSLEDWRQITNELLSTDTWSSRLQIRSARENLELWSTQNGGSTLAIKLLDRLLCDPNAARMVDQNHVKAVVQGWANDYITNETELTPTDLSKKLKEYQKVLPSLDDGIFRIVQQAARKRLDHQELAVVQDASISDRLEKANIESDPTLCPRVDEVNEYLWEVSGARKKRYNSLDTSVAQQVESILDQMWILHRRHGWDHVRPNYITYEIVMRSWLRTDHSAVGDTLMQLLNDMEQAYNTRFHNELKPGRIHYQLVFSALAKRGRAQLAENLLNRLKTMYEETGESDYKPTGKITSAVAAALARCYEPDAPERIKRYLSELYERYEKDGDEQWLPQSHFYSSYMNSLARSGRQNAAELVEAVRAEMVERGIRQNSFHYEILIDSWCRQGKPEHAQKVFDEMMHRYKQGEADCKPKVDAVLRLTRSWKESNAPYAEKKIESLVSMLEELNPSGRENVPISEQIDAECDLLKILSAKPRRKGDAQYAEHLLRLFQKQHAEGKTLQKPTPVHYAAVITAWSRSGESHAPRKAEALLTEVLRLYDEGDESMMPTEHAFTSAITCWGNSNTENSGMKAQLIFDSMLERYKKGTISLRPTFRSYAALINAWAKKGDVGRSMFLLQKMQEEFREGNHDVKPNRAVFNTVMSAWSRSRRPDAFDHAVQLLRLMQELGEDLQPDAQTFASLIGTCSHSTRGNVVEIAEAFFNEAKDLYARGNALCKPECSLYLSLIQTISRSGSADAAKKATMHLADMVKLREREADKILIAYGLTIAAWNRSDDKVQALENVELLFRELSDIASSDPACRPNAHIYAGLLKSIANSDIGNKRERVLTLLQRMENDCVKPDDVVQRLVGRLLSR